jgi:hypothetical protein
MKKIILIILVFGAISAVAFYASKSQPNDTADATTAPASKPIASVALPTAKVVPPTVKPVDPAAPVAGTKQVGASVAAQSSANNPEAYSPRAELASTIPELVRLISAQDFETLMKDFMPPNELKDVLMVDGQPGPPIALGDLAERMRQNPNFMQEMAGAAQFLTYLQTQTPTFDATGESASYPMPNPVNGQTSITFVKVGGYWYVKNGAQFFK